MSNAKKRNPERGCAAAFFNILTILALLGAGAIGFVFITLINNPDLVPEQYQPLDIPTIPPTLTEVPTRTPQPPTVPPPASPTSVPTATLAPSSTPLPSQTPFSLVTPPTEAVGPTEPGFAYEAPGSPTAIKNIYHTDLGCGWLGVGGQAIDQSGAPVVGLIVKLGGQLGGFQIDELTVSGTAAAIGYGQSGWEFTMADGPIESQNSLWVQLFDQAENPLSDKIVFDTFDDCNRNLIVINFVKVR
jgi:hypothetical protein